MKHIGVIVGTARPAGHGSCEVDWCRCKSWGRPSKGMSGIEVCSCGHMAQVHALPPETESGDDMS